MKQVLIREVVITDAEDLSEVIIKTLRESNRNDYSAEIIDNVVKSFSPLNILELMVHRKIYVAIESGHIVGTASLDGEVVRSVYVLPSKQGNKIGLALMNHLENLARQSGLSSLSVPSSITAEGFYKNLGYVAIRDEYFGEERTIIMKKGL